MGKSDGFLLYERKEDRERDIAERISDYEEIHVLNSPQERKKQAARCMNCGVPYCQSGIVLRGSVTGCPLHNLIPEWNDHIYRGNYEHSLHRLLKMNPFPEFTGRVCPALCEKACLNGIDGESVTIRDNERFLSEFAFENDLLKPHIPPVRSGRSAAVVGSGPAGLAAAYRLNQRGHNVTVYERDDEIGGLLMYGIPNMKLDKKTVLRRRSIMEQEGIVFVTDTEIGKDISLAQLREQYDAVILACGAKQARVPEIDCIHDTPEAVYAVQFLKESTKALPELPEINAKGKNVIVLGGGDTGNDCVGVSVRQGCASITQIEMMPKPPLQRPADNPWPQWPRTLKTDYGQKEAAYLFKKDPRIFSRTVTALIQEDGILKGAQTAEVRFENGRMVISEEREILPCDLLIIAAGFTGCEKDLPLSASIALTSRNTVETAPGSYASSAEGIFTAGDMHRGQSLVVWAILEGLQCAKEADTWLMGYTNLI